ncbi:MAG: cytochrome c [Reyranellaceae bacterium]
MALASVTLGFLASALAVEPTLTIEVGERRMVLSRDALLNHPQAVDVEVSGDVAYGRTMRYRAVPLSKLLEGFRLPQEGVLEATALDGFVAQLPLGPAIGRGRARAFVAIEPKMAPWPKLPGKQATAGPFYLVWQVPSADGIGPEQWPYQLASLTLAQTPRQRWPQIAVAAGLAADHPARTGEAMFVKHCIACHKLDGGGASEVGPDLNRPMNPVEYFQPAALRRYLRDPASVRHWPDQKMPGFAPEALSDAELDQLLAYLQHMSERRRP